MCCQHVESVGCVGKEAIMARNKRYVIVKSAIIRKKPDHNSNALYTVTFGKSVNLLPVNPVGNWLLVEVKENNGKHKIIHKGWILRRALIKTPVEDYARLRFINCTGKTVPISMRYNDPNVYKYLKIGEAVSMIARVGDWCLTDKGWTRFHWFQKDTDVFDQHAIDYLFYSVLEQAVKDYRRAISKLKQRNLDDEGFIRAIIMIDDVTSWFKSEEYKLFYDAVPGEERLRDLNQDIGIDSAWLKEKHRHARYLQEKRGI